MSRAPFPPPAERPGRSFAPRRVLQVCFAASVLIFGGTPAAAFTAGERTLLEARAERHDPAAQAMLGSAYLHGDGELAADPVKAGYWYEQAALEGDDFAQEALAGLYETGRGVPLNLRLAADWREKAARRGNTEAQYRLGRMYLDGRGVAKNSSRGRYWLRRAAIEGDDAAADFLRADHGEGNAAHASNGLSWSALQAYDSGIRLEHWLDRLGYSVREVMLHRRPDLHRLAADGDPEAEFRLAHGRQYGTQGEPVDPAAALAWYRAAAEHGHPGARAVLAEFARDGKLPDSRD